MVIWYNVSWPPLKKFQSLALPSDEGLTLETSALKLLMVANLRYQLSWSFQITLLYSSTDAAPQVSL